MFTSRIVSATVHGTAKAQAALNRRRAQFGRNFERGMIKGGTILFRAAQEIVPVDQGPLRASGSVRKVGRGLKTEMRIGYSAEYALLVHESLEFAHGEEFNIKYARQIANKDLQPWNGKAFHKRGPNQQAKFLERPAREKKTLIIKTILDEARKKT